MSEIIEESLVLDLKNHIRDLEKELVLWRVGRLVPFGQKEALELAVTTAERLANALNNIQNEDLEAVGALKEWGRVKTLIEGVKP